MILESNDDINKMIDYLDEKIIKLRTIYPNKTVLIEIKKIL